MRSPGKMPAARRAARSRLGSSGGSFEQKRSTAAATTAAPCSPAPSLSCSICSAAAQARQAEDPFLSFGELEPVHEHHERLRHRGEARGIDREAARPAALAQSCVATASIGTRWSAKPSMSAGCRPFLFEVGDSSSSISSARQSSPRTARTRAAGASLAERAPQPGGDHRRPRLAHLREHCRRSESRPCAAVCCSRSSSTSSGSDTSASDASRARTRAAAALRRTRAEAERRRDVGRAGERAGRGRDAGIAPLRGARPPTVREPGVEFVRVDGSSAARSLSASTGRAALSAAPPADDGRRLLELVAQFLRSRLAGEPCRRGLLLTGRAQVDRPAEPVVQRELRSRSAAAGLENPHRAQRRGLRIRARPPASGHRPSSPRQSAALRNCSSTHGRRPTTSPPTSSCCTPESGPSDLLAAAVAGVATRRSRSAPGRRRRRRTPRRPAAQGDGVRADDDRAPQLSASAWALLK